METVVSKIQETKQHAVKRTEAIVARTRGAGQAFLAEVRGAGQEIALFARAETKGWKRYVVQRTTQLKVDARTLLTVPAVERRLLAGVDGTIRTIDAKVRARLTALEEIEKAKLPRKAANGKQAATPAKKGEKGAKTAASAAKPGSPTATASVRH